MRAPETAERMTEGYSASVGVDPLILGVHPPLMDDGQRLGRKGFV